MAIDFFRARWSRIFSDAGLEMTGADALYFPQVLRDPGFTRTVVGFQKTDPNHRGTKLTRADNMALGKMFARIPELNVFVYVPKTTREIAQALIDRYGLPMYASMFVDIPITAEQVANMPFKIDLQLQPGPWCIQDNADFARVTVNEPNVDLADAFKNNVLDVPVLPYTIAQGATNVELVSIGTDFTPLYLEDYARLLEITTAADLSSAATPNVFRADVLVRLMEERTGIVTQRQATTERDILTTDSAKLLYHGKPSGYPTANTAYDRVLVFELVNCPSYTGVYYFHYNSLY